jgi:glycine cleavage system regulatory protein
MRIALPANVSINELRRRLEEVGAEKNIDVAVEPYSG